ncbi:hypothetical protein SETIT_5G167200v2 [Setaria italica]|uniref:Uncharacterized protein n=1 Tax=Setaria italica TaxID=4555 RepID=A0A368R5H0_SETIT|nr:hypothetical protein SETIT_5G167200v2 [Setaria italica]
MEYMDDVSAPSVLFNLPPRCPVSVPLPCLSHLSDVGEPSVMKSVTSVHIESDSPPEKGKGTPNDGVDTSDGRVITSPSTSPEKIKSRISPSTEPWSSTFLEYPKQGKVVEGVTDNTVKRSLRKKDQLKGFKSSSCNDKQCLGCSIDPPTISTSVIKNLGASFCKIDPAKLTDVPLKKRKTVAAPGGKKQPKKLSKEDDADGSKSAKKKSKK